MIQVLIEEIDYKFKGNEQHLYVKGSIVSFDPSAKFIASSYYEKVVEKEWLFKRSQVVVETSTNGDFLSRKWIALKELELFKGKLVDVGLVSDCLINSDTNATDVIRMRHRSEDGSQLLIRSNETLEQLYSSNTSSLLLFRRVIGHKIVEKDNKLFIRIQLANVLLDSYQSRYIEGNEHILFMELGKFYDMTWRFRCK